MLNEIILNKSAWMNLFYWTIKIQSIILIRFKGFMFSSVADLGGGGMGEMHISHQPKSNDFGRKISLYFE